jgi:hypothetical protein
MHDPLSMADERQLAEWAFGREGVVTDRELAEAALRELARRAEVAREVKREEEREAEREAVREAEQAAADTSHDDTRPDDDARATRTRTQRLVITLAAAIVLAAIIAIALVLAAARPVSSLVIFDRDPTSVEGELTGLVSQIGLGEDAEARVLAESETATVIAIRYFLLSSHSSGTVCVAVVEFEAVSDASCQPVDDFGVAGITATLSGRTGLFAIEWGPTGDPQIRLPGDFDVGPSGG